MTAWQAIPNERLMLYGPIGLRLIDDFTGLAPSGAVRVLLDRKDSNGAWEPTGVAAVRTPSGIVTFPGLGRSAHATTQPATPHRVRIEAAHYHPEYLMNLEGIEFDVHPYDDSTPPFDFPTLPDDIFLMPGPAYAFPSHIRVVRGEVRDLGTSDSVANVEVTESVNERTLTDDRGRFALPLRWPARNAAVQIDAVDHRTGRSGNLIINLPADLASGQVIEIT